ncbi:hypothetical protein B0H10DRAFT_906726 [Mycena sp. CBHHK59/15]|nr:hypothetical protein B0H10DRAFT_906726 [Mycena sp. CBHHK59/15]
MQKQTSVRNPISISSIDSSETFRLSPSTEPTSIACSDSNRWSEVVPPESGLTFAVVWDPEEKDILTFSNAKLSESNLSDRDSNAPDSPSDAYDNRSQILTIGPSAVPNSEYTATLQFFRDNHDFLFSEPTPFLDRPFQRRTQTSSTLDGLDVYLRGSLFGQAHNPNRYYSCFESLDGDFSFDPRTSFANMWMADKEMTMRDDVSDEGFFEGGLRNLVGVEIEGNLSSAFSTTTTSTSNYVSVDNDVDDDTSSVWSTLEAPNTPTVSRLLFADAPPVNHRLRKPRPTPAPLLHQTSSGVRSTVIIFRCPECPRRPIPPLQPSPPGVFHCPSLPATCGSGRNPTPTDGSGLKSYRK